MADRAVIRQHLIEQAQIVQPFDVIEKDEQTKLVSWLKEVDVFCRQSKHPDLPNPHVALLNVVLTPDKKKIALFQHKKSGLLLTPGGHLDEEETLQENVIREVQEELGIVVETYTTPPLFLSFISTIPSGDHWEFWMPIFFEESTDFSSGEDFYREFDGYQWYTFDEARKLSDIHPHIPRLLSKIESGYTTE